MPAVAGRWRKGMDRRSVRYLPLTRAVIAAHLAENDVFIGLYPLTKDNSCRFLVADFDGPTAMIDALAYVKAARADGVPAAVELSKSGRGAHVWVFFAGPVAGATARLVGTSLLHDAMMLRGSMDLRSYDRLFPNQDVLPDGGFGNLIAAPLQRKRRYQGLTVFLDLGTLEPYEDQWDFLSTLDRLSPGDAARIARRAKQTAIGVDVTTVGRSAATRVQPPLPALVRAELGANLIMEASQLTPAALTTFKHAASMSNPKFYELQRLRKSTWDTPRFIRGYDVTFDDQLVLPRGLRHRIAEIIERSGARLIMSDVRNPGREIDVIFNGELNTMQASAVSTMLAHDDGVLVAPPGAGKTVMACAVIAERATSTLVLVDRKALAEQWRTKLEDFLGIRPGQHGGGRKKLTGMIDIAMLPSLARRDDVAELTSGYGQIIVDECHHVAAAAYEHSVTKIGAQFWLGLTATPSRRDGLGDLVVWQLGPVRHALDHSEESTLIDVTSEPSVPNRELYVHETTLVLDDIDPSMPGAIAAAHHLLAADESRNAQIVKAVDHAISRGRNCLVLTRRVAHLEILTNLLAALGHQALVLQGGRSAKARRAVVDRLADAQVGDGVLVIGTTPSYRRGIRRPRAGHPVPGRADRVRRAAGAVRGAGGSRRAREGFGRGPRLPRPCRASARGRVAPPYAWLSRARFHAQFVTHGGLTRPPPHCRTVRGCPGAVRTTGPPLAHNLRRRA